MYTLISEKKNVTDKNAQTLYKKGHIKTGKKLRSTPNKAISYN